MVKNYQKKVRRISKIKAQLLKWFHGFMDTSLVSLGHAVTDENHKTSLNPTTPGKSQPLLTSHEPLCKYSSMVHVG